MGQMTNAFIGSDNGEKIPLRKSKDYVYGTRNLTQNLHTNSHFKMWAEKWTIMQKASGSSTAPNTARRISC